MSENVKNEERAPFTKKEIEDLMFERDELVAERENILSEKQEYLNLVKQVQADFDNFRKRTKFQLEEIKVDGIMLALDCVFDALDSFKKAEKVITDKSSLSGIKLIEEQMIKSLKKLNVEKINTINKPFNPEFHNAVAVIEDGTKKPNTIVEEIQAGYLYSDKVIRFSQVIVSK